MANTSNSQLREIIEELAKDVELCSRTLRGTNGQPGIVTAVAVIATKLDGLSERMAAIEGFIKNDIQHVIADVSGKKPNAKFASWEWFVEKALLPLLIGGGVGITLWLLTGVLPNLVP